MMTEDLGKDSTTQIAYEYSCPACGINGQVVDSLERVQELFEECSSQYHNPEFVKVNGSAASDD